MFLKKITIKNLTLSSNIFIAPLAGYTNLVTRRIHRMQGAGIAYAEMISAEGLNYNSQKSKKLIESDINDTPLGIQLFGSNADRIISAYHVIENEKFDLIDINCGCSVKKIIKSNSGAALLRDPDIIYQTVKGLTAITDKPVTCKIRSGWDSSMINFFDILDAAQSGGAALITLHPRTKTMLFSGNADWAHIKQLKEKSLIPVIGNGDIFTGRDAVRMMLTTGCDGVMLARGIIENPFLTEEVYFALSGNDYCEPDVSRRLEWCTAHCRYLVEFYGERRGILEFRKYIRGYTKGLTDAAKLRQMSQKINTYFEFNSLIEDYKDRYKQQSKEQL